MSNITLEQEEVAVLTELDDEKTVALVGGSSSEPPKFPEQPKQPEIPPIPKPKDYYSWKGRGGSLSKISLSSISIKIKVL